VDKLLDLPGEMRIELGDGMPNEVEEDVRILADEVGCSLDEAAELLTLMEQIADNERASVIHPENERFAVEMDSGAAGGRAWLVFREVYSYGFVFLVRETAKGNRQIHHMLPVPSGRRSR